MSGGAPARLFQADEAVPEGPNSETIFDLKPALTTSPCPCSHHRTPDLDPL